MVPIQTKNVQSQKTMAEAGPDRQLSARLLHWYDDHGRDLPWRTKGSRQDPYFVWLSEIMLQQTTVGAVKDYYRKFVAAWPTVKHLAAADRDDVMRAWAGLGYYARARNLHACAKKVADELGGRFPNTYQDLLELPGVGPYTAAAIAAIAFDRPVAAVDGNVDRVMARLYAIEKPLPAAKPEIRKRAEALVPQTRPGDFAQALMDLGATLCTPRAPNCLICPWAEDCDGRKRGIAESLPRKLPKKALPLRKAYAFWIERDGKVLLRQRPDKGLLGGMLEFPSTEWQAELPEGYVAPVDATVLHHAGSVEHTFTHFHLELTVLAAATAGIIEPPPESRWVAITDLGGEALPTVMRKVAAQVLQRRPPTSSR